MQWRGPETRLHGMRHGNKNKAPSKQWELLYEFALRYGELNIPLQHKSKYEKRKQLLCKDISRLFAGMAGEPITCQERGKHTYKTRFLVRVANYNNPGK